MGLFVRVPFLEWSPEYVFDSLSDSEKGTGDKVILWTCRCNDRLKEAVDFCKKYGLEFMQ